MRDVQGRAGWTPGGCPVAVCSTPAATAQEARHAALAAGQCQGILGTNSARRASGCSRLLQRLALQRALLLVALELLCTLCLAAEGEAGRWVGAAAGRMAGDAECKAGQRRDTYSCTQCGWACLPVGICWVELTGSLLLHHGASLRCWLSPAGLPKGAPRPKPAGGGGGGRGLKAARRSRPPLQTPSTPH